MSHIVILSAPSGTGKSSVINRIITSEALQLAFSISATNRLPRGTEQHGVEYYFLSDQEFQNYIEQDRFIEYIEVYPGRYYGTLKSELDRIQSLGRNLILDIDVEGALEVKRKYGKEVLTIFLLPPSLEELRHRLEGRGTDSAEVIADRLARAEYEIGLSQKFDMRFVNDDLERCSEEVREAIARFLATSTSGK